MLRKQPAFIREFNEFINRGNVIDLAVGVIIGAAFQKIVSSLVNDIIMPLVGTTMGGVDFSNLEITVKSPFVEGEAAHITYGNFIQNVVDFLIVAFCVFLFVKFINKITRRKDAKKEAQDKKDTKAQNDATAKTDSTNEEILKTLKKIEKKL
ncbi:MAG: large-conductance mechanosensitive channel protein MscL [Candidatus Saccharibacteria bacterium]|nr:large-conductance mechanosensitive channel protein MscL [Candidatus Saccharibacteria bacterium]